MQNHSLVRGSKAVRLTLHFVLLTSGVFASVGCKSVTDRLAGNRAAASAPTAEDEGPSIGEKMNGYITDCLNVFSEKPRACTRRSFGHSRNSKQPTRGWAG